MLGSCTARLVFKATENTPVRPVTVRNAVMVMCKQARLGSHRNPGRVVGRHEATDHLKAQGGQLGVLHTAAH